MKATRLTMLFVKDVELLQHDPKMQYKFNRFMVFFWLVQMPIILILLLWFNKFWIIIALVYVTEISLWALVEGHFGNMSSAIAAINTTAKVDDILEDTSSLTPVQSPQATRAVWNVPDTDE